MLTIEIICEALLEYDIDDLVSILGLTNKDIIKHFKNKIISRHKLLNDLLTIKEYSYDMD